MVNVTCSTIYRFLNFSLRPPKSSQKPNITGLLPALLSARATQCSRLFNFSLRQPGSSLTLRDGPSSPLEIGRSAPVGVADDEAGVRLFGDPRRREAAGHIVFAIIVMVTTRRIVDSGALRQVAVGRPGGHPAAALYRLPQNMRAPSAGLGPVDHRTIADPRLQAAQGQRCDVDLRLKERPGRLLGGRITGASPCVAGAPIPLSGGSLNPGAG
jgi:hypothetical protein